MEFGHKHIEQLPMENLSTNQFLALAIETTNQLGWVFGNINELGFVAYTNNGLFAWNAEVKLNIINGVAKIQSESMGNGLVDVRGNKNNLQHFISIFRNLKKAVTPEELMPLYEKLKANFI
jgi:rhomboid protease GluP